MHKFKTCDKPFFWRPLCRICVSSSPPPQHVESTSVACVKRESVSSRTMALAATAMLGIAAIGSFWTHFLIKFKKEIYCLYFVIFLTIFE